MKKIFLCSLIFLLSTSTSAPIFAAIPFSSGTSTETCIPYQSIDKKEKEKKKKQRSKSSNGVLSMSFGIASLIFFPLLGIPALIFGAISLTKKEPNNSYAISGLIMGGLSTLLSIALAGLLIAGVL